MTDHERARGRDDTVIVASPDELLQPATRRGFLRMLGVGGSIVLLPGVFGACSDDDEPTGNDGGNNGNGNTLDRITFDLRNDVGIFRLVHLNEMLEAAFYTAVVAGQQFATFTAEEQELFRDLRDVEIIHREFIARALGTAALPDVTTRLNTTTLNGILSSKANIIATARMLENQGVAALNGAGKYLKDARNLLIAGKAVSVEARHAAALRDLAPPAGVTANTAFAGDDITDTNGRDVKLEATTVLARVRALNVIAEPLNSNITISNAPDAAQGVASTDFFPANP